MNGFSGRQFDAESSLYYNRARMYSPALGRFSSTDPLGYGGGDINVYRYTQNNPVTWKDPTGTTITYAPTDPNIGAITLAVVELYSTSQGQALINAVNGSCVNYTIGSGEGNYYDSLSNTISLNISDPATVMTTNGELSTPLSAVLGHELGHAAGTGDTGPGNMNNVITNENPVRQGLGIPLRISY